MKPQVEEAIEAELLKRAQKDLRHVAVTMVHEGPGVIINEPLKSRYDQVLHNYSDRSSISGSDEVTPASAAFNRARYALRHFDDLGPETLVRSLGDLWREGGGTCVRKDIAEEALVNQVMIGTPGRPKIEAAKLLSTTCGTLTPAGGRAALHSLGALAERLKEGHEYSPIDADLALIDLSGLALPGSNLIGANLTDANLAGADLTNANLTGANLAGADLTNANLTGANLAGAALADANLTGANLAGAALADASLSHADLSYANLTGVKLSGANMADANLIRADLTVASLFGANLTRAYLTGANLFGADLVGANLTGADLRTVLLRGNVVEMTDFTDVRRNDDDETVPGWRRNAVGRLERDYT